MEVNEAIYTAIGMLEGHIAINNRSLKKEDKEYIAEIIDTLKSIEAENKAYREMWEELKKTIVHDGMKDYEMSELEDKYLGGEYKEEEEVKNESNI